MKKLKIALLNLFMAIFVLSSCTNDDANFPTPQNDESAALRTAITEFSEQFDANGNLDANQNRTGNIVFDYCFNYVFPIDLVYNNGTTVTVNDLEGYIEVVFSGSEDLYVSGIVFPFDVEVFNEETASIDVVTIANEEEFLSLIESCEFDEDDQTLPCDDTYDPVCVEITDPNGQSFVMTFPNACWAELEGFTEADFLADCADNNGGGDATDCFTLNYPLSVVLDNGDVVTVADEAELEMLSYDQYIWDFVYPLTITFENGETAEVNSIDELFEAFLSCVDDNDNDNDQNFPCEECENSPYDPVCVTIVDPATGDVFTIKMPNECWALCEGFTQDQIVDCENDDDGGNDDDNDFPCEDCVDAPFDPVCVEFNGDIIPFPNACWALCDGFSEEDFVDCDTTDGNDEPYPCEECENAPFDPVCVQVVDEATGEVCIFELPNMCWAECEGFTQDQIVDCDTAHDGNDGNDEPNPCEDCEDAPFDPVCVTYVDPATGDTVTFEFPNACWAECEGLEIVDCE